MQKDLGKMRVLFLFLISFSTCFSQQLKIDDVVVDLSSTEVVVNVYAYQFIDILSYQAHWNLTPHLIFDSVSNFGHQGLNTGNFGIIQAANGLLSFAWFDNQIQVLTIADSTVVFSIYYSISTNATRASPISDSATHQRLKRL